METQSQKIIKKATEEGKMPIPYLQLATKVDGGGVKTTGPHKVKFLSDRIVKGKEYRTNIERNEVEYILEEKGIKKKYNVALKNDNGEPHYFVVRMSEINYGEEIILEYKRDGLKGFISTERVVNQEAGIKSNDEIPVIEEEQEPKKVVPVAGGSDKEAEEFFEGEVPGDDDINVNDIPF